MQRVAPTSAAAAEGSGDTPGEPTGDRTRRLHNLDEALAMPLLDRAKSVKAHADIADWCQPQEWPEVQRIARLYAQTFEVEPLLGAYSASAATRRLVDAFAAGLTPTSLGEVVRALKTDSWWLKHGQQHGLDALSLQVISRVLNATRPDRVEVDRLLREAGVTKRRKRDPGDGPATLGDVLKAGNT